MARLPNPLFPFLLSLVMTFRFSHALLSQYEFRFFISLTTFELRLLESPERTF